MKYYDLSNMRSSEYRAVNIRNRKSMKEITYGAKKMLESFHEFMQSGYIPRCTNRLFGMGKRRIEARGKPGFN